MMFVFFSGGNTKREHGRKVQVGNTAAAKVSDNPFINVYIAASRCFHVRACLE